MARPVLDGSARGLSGRAGQGDLSRLRGDELDEVFNPVIAGYEHMALAEVEDALAVYAEMNAFGELLRGEPLNLEVPPPQSDAVLWSGRRLVDRAVIRTFKQGAGEGSVQVEAWPGRPVTLGADAVGRTYRLRLDRTGVEIEAIQAR